MGSPKTVVNMVAQRRDMRFRDFDAVMARMLGTALLRGIGEVTVQSMIDLMTNSRCHCR